MGRIVNILLEERGGTQFRAYDNVEEPELDADGTFELDGRRWRFSHTYRAVDARRGEVTVYRAARPVDWLAR
jgi:hypothetical protein